MLTQSDVPGRVVAQSLACLLALTLTLVQARAAAGFTNALLKLPGLHLGSVAWGDYDGDGRLDLVQFGAFGTNEATHLWHNTGSGFEEVRTDFPVLSKGAAAWGDYNNDGRLDLVLTGSSGSGAFTHVWRNTGTGFSLVDAPFPGLMYSWAAWGDFDNDGRLDLAISGYADLPTMGPTTEIWRNVGSTFVKHETGITGVYNCCLDWGDYDNDGRLDLLVTGRTEAGTPVSEVWRNTGAGFSNANAGLPGVYQGAASWRDYDNDGALDILLAGRMESGDTLQLWRNSGSSFTRVDIPIPGLRPGSVTWGDYDNDGRADLLVTGFRAGAAVAELWRNTGSGFTNSGLVFSPMYNSATAWGDFNNDGKLDVLLQGSYGTNLMTQLWIGTGGLSNAAPSAPAALVASVTGPRVRLSWAAGADTETPSSGLTYNIRVGTFSSGGNVLSPECTAAGARLLPQAGNAGQRTFSVFTNLSPGLYFWSVQTVDSGLRASTFAPQRFFVVGGASALAITNTIGGEAVLVRANGPASFTLQVSTNLQTWNRASTINTGSDGTAAWTNYTPGEKRFYRLMQ